MGSWSLLSETKSWGAGRHQGLHRAPAAQAQVGEAAWTLSSTSLKCSSAVETGCVARVLGGACAVEAQQGGGVSLDGGALGN